MTDIEKKQIVEIIHTEISKIEGKIEGIREHTAPIAPDDAIGRVSRMDAINSKSIFEASMRNLQERLQQLTYIINTVNDADFGICTKCRQSIPIERMKIRPEIRLCANCFRK
jgi:DnaK suppressor protein